MRRRRRTRTRRTRTTRPPSSSSSSLLLSSDDPAAIHTTVSSTPMIMSIVIPPKPPDCVTTIPSMLSSISHHLFYLRIVLSRMSVQGSIFKLLSQKQQQSYPDSSLLFICWKLESRGISSQYLQEHRYNQGSSSPVVCRANFTKILVRSNPTFSNTPVSHP